MEPYAGQVLIADDDPFVCELLRAELEEAHFRVTVVASLPELRKCISQRSYDFVLLDLFLEDENAIEAIPFLVRESPYSKIIVMSAHGTIELAVDAMEQGASYFISKSKDPKVLVTALKDKMVIKTHTDDHPILENYGIIGNSPGILDVLQKINRIRDADSIVLITGESGTGKELVARAIHASSKCSQERFEAINCGAIPENLLESELFGYKKGAFTDAKTDRMGLFELCQNGTLFLDEIGDLPFNLQVKLLRALEEHEILPLGCSETIKVNTRVIAATNKNLPTEVKEGRFREDLYYRLNVLWVNLPALRERRADIPLLIGHFLKRFNQRFGKTVAFPTKELEARLVALDWPGNIRQLQNALERGVILSVDGQLHFEDMIEPESHESPSQPFSENVWSIPLSDAKRDFEKAYLQRLLEATRGNISEIARISGRYRADIYRLMSKYGVEWEEFRRSSEP
jgi:DNA-binding NtrC family response regulator